MLDNFKIIDYPYIFNILKSIEYGKKLKSEEYISLMIELIKKKRALDELINKINKLIN